MRRGVPVRRAVPEIVFSIWLTILTRRLTTSTGICRALLLDTHAFLWFVRADRRLSEDAGKLIAESGNDVAVSVASLWEVSIKTSIGKLRLADPLDEFFKRELSQNGFTLLPIQVEHVVAVAKLPFNHRDPFDRMLAAQAIVEEIPLVTADSVFNSYPVDRIW